MSSLQKNCEFCKKDFLVLEKEIEFLKRKDIPLPTECPKCRQDKRLAMRNERNLHKRKCNNCQEEMISPYSADSTYTVYCQRCFWEYTG